MADWALIRISTNAFLRRFAAESPPLQPNPAKDAKWLPLTVTDPPFDPETQVKEGPVITVGAESATMVWTVRAKNAGELDAEKDAEVAGIDVADGLRAVARVLFQVVNEVRVLQAQPTLSAAQFIALLKSKL